MNEPAHLVARIRIRILERRRHRQGGGAALQPRPVDALLERAEADALPTEPEALAQARQRHEVVVGLREFASASDGRLT